MACAGATWIIRDEARWWREVLDRQPSGRHREPSRWALLLLAGLVTLSAVVVVTKAYQGLLRPGDVWLLAGWVVVATVIGVWRLRRARRGPWSSGP